MPIASALRIQIEAALAQRVPSALTPAPRAVRPVAPTGVRAIDALLDGGFPVGAITEMTGPECSGRSSLALSFIAQMTQAAKVCAWVDASDTLHPESAAACGVDLRRLLWVRCGVASAARHDANRGTPFVLPSRYLAAPPVIKGLHGGGFGPHPRREAKGLPEAMHGLLHVERSVAGRPQPHARTVEPTPMQRPRSMERPKAATRPWTRLDQALRVTDLLLQGGGFGAIVLDLGSIAPEQALRIPLATWFRYRAAAERTQTSILLLTQHACAKSSAALVVPIQQSRTTLEERTVFTGTEHRIEVSRQRWTQENVVPLRKPPRRATGTDWASRTAWAGSR